MNSDPMQTDENHDSQPPIQNGRKSVSFPGSSAIGDNETIHSPTSAKILSRKPTPFNADLAASIRNSDLSEFMKKPDESMEQPEQTNGTSEENTPKDPIQDLDAPHDHPTMSSTPAE